MKPRVLIFSIAYIPFIGGAEIAIKNITDRIDHYFFDLITARLDKKMPPKEVVGRVTVYRVGRGWALDKYLFPLLAVIKAARLHKRKSYAISWGVMANYAGIAAFLFQSLFPRVKYALTLQSGDSEIFMWARTWFWYPLYRMVYSQADIVHAISRHLAGRARRHGYKGDIKVIPNGVDIDVFRRSFGPGELEELKKKVGFSPDDKILITTSRLVKKNAVGDIISSLAFLEDRVKLLIIGTGKMESSLKRMARRRGLEGRVKFIGLVPHEKIAPYLMMSDIFVRPSLTEGLGNSFLEAMLCKVPVVGTGVGGLKDFLVHGKTGMVCRTHDPRSIAKAVEEIFSDDELKRRIVSNGFDLVMRNYDWKIVAAEMKDLFGLLLARGA